LRIDAARHLRVLSSAAVGGSPGRQAGPPPRFARKPPMPTHSIRFALSAAATAAAGAALFLWLPGWTALVLLAFAALLAPAALLSGIVFARGYGRAFALGCATTGGPLCLGMLFYLPNWLIPLLNGQALVGDDAIGALKLAAAALLALVLCSGLAAMAVRSLAVTGSATGWLGSKRSGAPRFAGE